MKLTITSPARAVWDADDAPLQDLSLLGLPVAWDETFGEYLDEPLLEAGVLGGAIKILMLGTRLAVEASFWAPGPFSETLKAQLLAEAMGQWSDGAGENGFQLPTPHGKALVVPCHDASEATLAEVDDGRYVPPASALARAANHGRITEMEEALAQGEDINAKLGGYNGLPLALMSGHAAAARLLIERGIDLSEPDKDGYLPLLWVALANGLSDEESAALALELLARGASVDATHPNGHTAAYYAANRKKLRLLAVLQNHR